MSKALEKYKLLSLPLYVGMLDCFEFLDMEEELLAESEEEAEHDSD